MTDPVSGAVTVAYCHPNEIAHSWHASLLDLIGWDADHDGRVLAGGWLAMKCGTNGLVEARNQAVAQFLTERDAEWLWWVDSDMGFASDIVDQLVAAADPNARPIVGGLCFAQKETTPDGMRGYRTEPRPTIFDWVGEGSRTGFMGRRTYPINSLVQCAGTGSACLLIHRSVLERIGEKFGTWYDRLPNESDGTLFGEDLSFCIRAGAVGAPIFVHTGARTSHLKHAWVQEADYWAAAVAPPATEPVAVIVPVLGRPQNAASFMASLRASTGWAKVYAVAGPEHDMNGAYLADSTRQTVLAWRDAGATVLNTPAVTFAQKVNAAQSMLGAEPWVFLVGDDVRFHPGWLDHAQAAAGDRFHVVGTNDLGNPRVMAGEHATHLLIRRSYIDEVGAGWDGPGIVTHEGYRHWFVDDEIVTAARQRGVWAMALGSRVEHLHPFYGKADDDDTYRLGQAAAKADQELFQARLEHQAVARAGVVS